MTLFTAHYSKHLPPPTTSRPVALASHVITSLLSLALPSPPLLLLPYSIPVLRMWIHQGGCSRAGNVAQTVFQVLAAHLLPPDVHANTKEGLVGFPRRVHVVEENLLITEPLDIDAGKPSCRCQICYAPTVQPSISFLSSLAGCNELHRRLL